MDDCFKVVHCCTMICRVMDSSGCSEFVLMMSSSLSEARRNDPKNTKLILTQQLCVGLQGFRPGVSMSSPVPK